MPWLGHPAQVLRRGLSEKLQARIAGESDMKSEHLLRKVKHLTHGVIFGSREFINGWFEQSRAWFRRPERREPPDRSPDDQQRLEAPLRPASVAEVKWI